MTTFVEIFVTRAATLSSGVFEAHFANFVSVTALQLHLAAIL
jgi:hypothetical protein